MVAFDSQAGIWLCGTGIPSRDFRWTPAAGQGSEHIQLLQPTFQCGGTHAIGVIGMEDQLLPAPFADLLPQAGATPQPDCRRTQGVFRSATSQATTLRLQSLTTR